MVNNPIIDRAFIYPNGGLGTGFLKHLPSSGVFGLVIFMTPVLLLVTPRFQVHFFGNAKEKCQEFTGEHAFVELIRGKLRG